MGPTFLWQADNFMLLVRENVAFVTSGSKVGSSKRGPYSICQRLSQPPEKRLLTPNVHEGCYDWLAAERKRGLYEHTVYESFSGLKTLFYNITQRPTQGRISRHI